MSERVNLAELRRMCGFPLDTGGLDHGQILVDPDEVLALVEAVEAAADLALTPVDSSHEQIMEAKRRLIAILARFDFGEAQP